MLHHDSRRLPEDCISAEELVECSSLKGRGRVTTKDNTHYNFRRGSGTLLPLYITLRCLTTTVPYVCVLQNSYVRPLVSCVRHRLGLATWQNKCGLQKLRAYPPGGPNKRRHHICLTCIGTAGTSSLCIGEGATH
jgi:hypothetical protein